MRALTLRTPRLELVASTLELAHADLAGRDAFANAIGADVPESWPPPLNDEASQRWIVHLLETSTNGVGWAAWYFIHREATRRTVIGNGGFKGPPTTDGTVEIGYSVIEAEQRRGIAPEAAGALVSWAFSHPEVRRVIAHTLTDGRPSMRVLEKCDFHFVGPGEEEGTVLFERLRPAGVA